MRYLLYIVFSFTLLFTSCSKDVAGTSNVFSNPLDPVTAEEEGFITPAIVFFPSEVTVAEVYEEVTLDVHAMQVPNLGGAHIQISYNKQKLSLANLSLGSFFEASEGLIYHEDDTDFGLIDIYMGFLGTDSSEVTGTGQLAILQFQAISGGASTVAFTDYSEFVDHEDNDIAILGKGTCIVTVGN